MNAPNAPNGTNYTIRPKEMGPAEFTGNRKTLKLFTCKPTNDVCIKRLKQNGKQ